MNAAAKKLIDEINELLSLSEDFPEKYDNYSVKGKIGGELYEDLLFFHKRVKYIFSSLKLEDYNGRVNRFKFTHVTLDKSYIHNFDKDLFEVRAALKTVKKELEKGLLYKVSELVTAEVFSDFLEYAKYLLDKGFIHSVPVIVGSVLESELRKMSEKNGLPTKTEKDKNLTIEPMNENLGREGIYEMKVQKRITALTQIRNDAAHGHYDLFSKEDVEDMYDYVLKFNT